MEGWAWAWMGGGCVEGRHVLFLCWGRGGQRTRANKGARDITDELGPGVYVCMYV